ncbi:hypothetical protein Desaci_2614 [Desulfosporosinus acidiphilus SJ4]|uniref:Ferredoxin n=1 Tax=Desulfosporosinus acidiphilus (strain DSM 22704 / JCM 16185 / SJ4) TaxID=646529 RepID=I4D6X3_DESAJ|nr:EFR1 family ferrodoxin [Desulfosporosinus acidiphilus]AFM41547.1 hypothetical protein Desaci_2614 [Desulfosporosinus acidiphilus SJ4]
MTRSIRAMYFSPTGTTQKIITGIAGTISKHFAQETHTIDFTLPEERMKPISFSRDDIVIIGVPVYAGRVPNVLLKYLTSIMGNDALAIAVVLYGNRNYDDALIELRDILNNNGFKVIAGGAFIGEHSFSKTLAQNRPDEKDMNIVEDFANQIINKMRTSNELQTVNVKGNQPYRNYYKPINKEGIPVDIRKVTPKTNDRCLDCKLCVTVCPMGSIDPEDVTKLKGICIKCGACIKKCPSEAKYYDDQDYLRHKQELELEFSSRNEPELFL